MKITYDVFSLVIMVFVLHYVNYTAFKAGILDMILPHPEGIVISNILYLVQETDVTVQCTTHIYIFLEH